MRDLRLDFLIFCVSVFSLFSAICEKAVFAPLHCLRFIVKGQLTVFMGVYFWVLDSVPSTVFTTILL